MPSDHVDAWLMSYADMITLLFMLFVIFVSFSVSKHGPSLGLAKGEPPHPYIEERNGLMKLGMPFDELHRMLKGIVAVRGEDQNAAVEKTSNGIWIDLSTLSFFGPASADIPESRLPLIKALAQALKKNAPEDLTIAVEGYTDDQPLAGSMFANNWELSAMRAARIVNILIAEGIDPSRLRATSYAGSRPLVPNVDAAGNPIAENRNRNQRIVIKAERMF